ncbi:MAG TPA: hypothetical protein VGX28_09935 [Frankiaceae bacterium]|jgi:hypothetical protein|nr:hypothetical protein [Frankiaceae bacterium]
MKARPALAAALLPAALLTAAPARAVPPVVLLIDGNGTYFPGYGTSPTPQSMRMTGTATDVATGAVHACAWELQGLADTIAQGVGTWKGTCGPYVFASCAYTRAGTDATVACPSGWGGKLVWVVDLATAYTFTVTGPLATP